MNKIPTAEEFLKENANDISYEEGQMFAADVTPDILIQFTKLHVKAALEAAAENAEIEKRTFLNSGSEEYGSFIENEHDTKKHRFVIYKDSILNAYPENLIQ